MRRTRMDIASGCSNSAGIGKKKDGDDRKGLCQPAGGTRDRVPAICACGPMRLYPDPEDLPYNGGRRLKGRAVPDASRSCRHAGSPSSGGGAGKGSSKKDSTQEGTVGGGMHCRMRGGACLSRRPGFLRWLLPAAGPDKGTFHLHEWGGY